MGNSYIVNDITRSILTTLFSVVLLGFLSPPTFAQDLGGQDSYTQTSPFPAEKVVSADIELPENLTPPVKSNSFDHGDDEAFDVIFELKRDREVISPAIIGLEKNGKYYLPVQEISRLIGIKANVNLAEGTVAGFISKEENNFSLNAKTGELIKNNNAANFDSSDAIILEQSFGIGELYITTDLMNKIWPLDLVVDPLKQVANIQTNRDLPYELLAQRQQKRDRRLQKKKIDTSELTGLKQVRNDYKSFSLPAIDFTSTTRFNNSRESGIGQGLNISGRNDFLKTQANYNFNFDKDPGETLEFQNARLLFERQSYEKGDMPLGLQLFQAGDIRPQPSRLIDGTFVGRGVLLSTEPQKQLRDFDQITVEGFAEPGWEVELYRNNELVDFQVVDSQGEYRFEDVSLNFNKTIIKTILYGPEGQIIEQEEDYNISNAMLKPGKTILEASILDFNDDLIQTDRNRGNAPTGIVQNYKVKRGINSWLSAFTTFTATPTRQDDRRYATLGFNLSLFGVSSLVEAYKDLSGGTAIDFRTAGSFLGTNINLRTSALSDFESQEAGFDDASRTSDIELTLSRPFKLPFGNLGFRFRFDHERFEENADQTEFDFSQTFAKNGLRITHGNSINLIDGDRQFTDGRINATYRINPNWQLRSLLNYNIFPQKDMRNVLSELRYKDGYKFTAAADIDRDFLNHRTRLGGQVAYDFDTVRTAFDVDWESEEGWRAFLRASFSMAPYGKDNSYLFSSKNLSNRAALDGRVFLDKNYDGKYNGDDIPIEDALINVGKRSTNLSGTDGYARYIGGPKQEYENVVLNLDSLQNPYAISPAAGYSTLLRPGTRTFVDFPVVETGVIDGTISSDEGPFASVRMHLVKNGDIVGETTTAFDGYYTFEFVEPGRYQVRIDPSYEQLNIPPREILVTSEKLFHYGVDFQIIEQADEVACVETDVNGKITQDCRVSSTQSGVQPAHIIQGKENYPSYVTDIRVSEHEDYSRIIIDLSAPVNFTTIQAFKKKEMTIELPTAGWKTDKKWEAKEPKILRAYSFEKRSLGGSRIILKPVKTIRIKQKEALKANGLKSYRLIFDVTK